LRLILQFWRIGNIILLHNNIYIINLSLHNLIGIFRGHF
jgi:hypothetical protein